MKNRPKPRRPKGGTAMPEVFATQLFGPLNKKPKPKPKKKSGWW